MTSSGLDESRAVQLLAVRGGEAVRAGSGYLVAEDLVLTAAHVVADADELIVRRVVGRQQVRDCVGVTEWLDTGADVAVVRRKHGADAESSGVGDLPPPRYGRVVGDGLVSCQALGFPRFKLRPADAPGLAAYRDTYHAIGEIPPFSNLREGTLEINVPPPEHDPDPAHSPWEGMSGAAVFAGEALIGVISEHHRRDGLGRLAAQRVRDWHDLKSEQVDRLRVLIGLPEFGRLARVGAASAESHYLERVVRRDIAPDVLYGRDAELAELARFCTDDRPDAPPYTWWRGPAWSGKSALMSWFAIHPPAGIQIIAFFLREQVPHQNTWIDCADNLMQQSAALLGRQVPTGLTDATRREALLALMDEAAESCRRRGERLVLVLDGLDEDQGGHSVAWLLPAEPSAGMRVIVSGRDHPPLPEGVLDEDHPLCDDAVVRVLAGSDHAKMMRRRAAAEIRRLAEGSELERLLLGLVTAARGGLSEADLAYLAQCDEFEVRRQLEAVTGRTFTMRASRYRPDDGPKLCVLAHRDLPAMAEDKLGRAPLERARQRLHAWFDDVRARRWPADTPEYLLHGYFDMLSEAGDVDRMVACGTDPARHHRMLDVTGGHAAALTEVKTAQQAILRQDDPDLLGMTRLAIHHKALIDRNECLSERLPQVWARLGNPVRAESLARSITQPGRKDFALSLLASRAAEFGDFDRAEALAAAVTEPLWRAESLTAAVRAATGRGENGRALEFAGEAESAAAAITDPGRQARVVAELSLAVVAAGDGDRALQIAGTITDPGGPVSERLLAMGAVAQAVAATGDLRHARVLADAIGDPEGRDSAVARIAYVLAQSRDLEGVRFLAGTVANPAYRDDALIAGVTAAVRAGNVEDAEALSATITRPEIGASALTLVASALAASGDRVRAVEAARRAEAVVATLDDPTRRRDGMLELATVYAQAGDVDRAEAIVRSRTDPQEYYAGAFLVAPLIAATDVDRAVAVAESAATESGRAEVLRKVASSVGEVHGRARAIAVLRRAEAAAAEITDPHIRAAVTGGMALIADANGDVGFRNALIAAIGDVKLANTTLRDVALRAARAGNADDAVALALRARDRTWLLADATGAAAAAGKLDAAEAIARSMGDLEIPPSFVALNTHHRVQALADVANAAAQTGEHARATRLADEAEMVAYSAVPPNPQRWALESMATAMATAGDVDSGLIVASYLASPESRERTLAEICEVAATAGDPDSAEGIATAITDPSHRAIALAAAGRARARAGDQARATELARQAEGLVPSVPGRYEQGVLLVAMALRAAAGGDATRAGAWADQAASLMYSQPDSPAKGTLSVGVATAVAAAGDWARAEAMAAHITDAHDKAEALVAVAHAMATAGERERAENLAETIGDSSVQAAALAEVAKALSQAGDHPSAVGVAQRAVAIARSISEERPRALGVSLTAMVIVLARAGEIHRAETIARVADASMAARLQVSLAEVAPPLPARRAMARALALGGGWAWILPTLAKVDGGTVRAIVDEFVMVLGPS